MNHETGQRLNVFLLGENDVQPLADAYSQKQNRSAATETVATVL